MGGSRVWKRRHRSQATLTLSSEWVWKPRCSRNREAPSYSAANLILVSVPGCNFRYWSKEMVRHTENWRIRFHLSRLGPPCPSNTDTHWLGQPFQTPLFGKSSKTLGSRILWYPRHDSDGLWKCPPSPIYHVENTSDKDELFLRQLFRCYYEVGIFFQTGIPSADIQNRICYIPETTHIAIWTIDIKSLTPEMKMLPSAWYSHN